MGRILVIDDSEVMLDRIRRALEGEGFEVITSTRAVGNARHIPTCDLVLIDYHMPGLDGGTVVQSLREAAAGRPCAFYVYTSDPVVAHRARQLGFDGAFSEKGDEGALVRQVLSVFRLLQMRAMARRSRPPT
jgi:CheY-like chemotaxis protein